MYYVVNSRTLGSEPSHRSLYSLLRSFINLGTHVVCKDIGERRRSVQFNQRSVYENDALMCPERTERGVKGVQCLVGASGYPVESQPSGVYTIVRAPVRGIHTVRRQCIDRPRKSDPQSATVEARTRYPAASSLPAVETEIHGSIPSLVLSPTCYTDIFYVASYSNLPDFQTQCLGIINCEYYSMISCKRFPGFHPLPIQPRSFCSCNLLNNVACTVPLRCSAQ